MKILYEDAAMMAVFKPAGLSSESGRALHPSAEKMAQALLADRGERMPPGYPRAVHRLDRATSGVLLLAKRASALKALMAQFEQRSVRKRYEAITMAAPAQDAGEWRCWLLRHPTDKATRALREPVEGAQLAVLQYRVRPSEQAGLYCWEITPLTGRYHQIRAQLALEGCPIVGDVLYGGQPWKPFQIRLCAVELALAHPISGQPLRIVVDALPCA